MATYEELKTNNSNASDQYTQSLSNYQEALDNLDQAKQAEKEALNKLPMDGYSTPNEEDMKAYSEAVKAKEAAKETLAAAETAAQEASENAESAKDAYEKEKRKRDTARPKDISYVVENAEVQCPFGMTPGYILLKKNHGVYIKGMAQATISDNVPNTEADFSFIHFGGCNSRENPDTMRRAEQVIQDAKDEIEKNKGFGDHVVDFFVGKKEVEVDDSLLENCYGDCTPQIADEWIKGKDDVEIDGANPLFRRSELICAYGGVIILDTNGQPEV